MNYARMLTDVIFPPRCPGCGEIISFASRMSYYEGRAEESTYLHKKCRKNFQWNDQSICRRCGTPVHPGTELCVHCLSGHRSFEEGRSVFLYRDSARTAMMGVKYHSRKEYCDYLSFAAVQFLGDWIREKNISILIPVPVHPKRRRQRGYNQAEELAKRIGTAMGLLVVSNLLCRVRNTRAQKDLTPEERRMNLMDAFDVSGKLPADSRVLLVDDIYTTGATMDMCAWTLKMKGGARSVFCLSICAAVYL